MDVLQMRIFANAEIDRVVTFLEIHGLVFIKSVKYNFKIKNIKAKHLFVIITN